MRILVIGTGYVGLVSGTCFAEIGHEVVCLDHDSDKIKQLNKGKVPIFEPGLGQLIAKRKRIGNLHFTTKWKEALKDQEVVFLAVGTPTDPETGRANLSYLHSAVETLAQHLTQNITVVTKSTVPVGTGKHIKAMLEEKAPQYHCEVVSNPEFLREGSAVYDFMHPDRIIVGTGSERGKHIMQELYQPLANEGAPVLYMNIETAELTKYASNAFLATKIAFINEMADLCEGAGADIKTLVTGMAMDHRIGGKYMQPGPGFGGSCFPKDTSALTHIAQDCGTKTRIVEAVIEANDTRKKNMAKKIIHYMGGDVSGKTITVLGLTFKANTDDLRYSPSLVIIASLLEAGANIRCYDPMGMEHAQKEIRHDQLSFHGSSYEASTDSHAVVIATEWDEFAQLSPEQLAATVTTPTVIDLRNMLNKDAYEKAGFSYYRVGSQRSKKD